MEVTLDKYYEALIQTEIYKEVIKEFRLDYPKYKPQRVKNIYDYVRQELLRWRDLAECCNWLLHLGIPLDEFNRVYAQATSEVTDFLNRYETDAFLNVFMADHTLSAYMRYDRQTKELTYNVAPIYVENLNLPDTHITDEYCEISIISSMLLSELHSDWKEYGDIQDYECLGSPKFINRNYMLESAYIVLMRMFDALRKGLDIRTSKIKLPEDFYVDIPKELPKELYNTLLSEANLSQ